MSIENKEQIIGQVSAAMAQDVALRERVRALVIRALAERQGNAEGVRDVLRQTFSGVGDGAMRRGGEAVAAAREAVHGLDEALSRSVYALRMALEEARGQGREFADADLKTAADDLKDLEADLLSTLKDSADKSQGWVKETLSDLHGHLLRNGTDTGIQVKGVMELFGNRLASAMQGAGDETKQQVREAGGRLAEVASGVLRGLADAVDARRS